MTHKAPALQGWEGLRATAASPGAPHLSATHAAARTAAATDGPRKAVQLATLLGSAQSVDIVHGEHTYRLQITKAGKLILTK